MAAIPLYGMVLRGPDSSTQSDRFILTSLGPTLKLSTPTPGFPVRISLGESSSTLDVGAKGFSQVCGS